MAYLDFEVRKYCCSKTFNNTRWSAHADATNVVYTGYDRIKEALTSMLEDDTVNRETQYDAESLLRQMKKFQIIFLCIFWNDVLTRFNTTSSIFRSGCRSSTI